MLLANDVVVWRKCPTEEGQVALLSRDEICISSL